MPRFSVQLDCRIPLSRTIEVVAEDAFSATDKVESMIESGHEDVLVPGVSWGKWTEGDVITIVEGVTKL